MLVDSSNLEGLWVSLLDKYRGKRSLHKEKIYAGFNIAEDELIDLLNRGLSDQEIASHTNQTVKVIKEKLNTSYVRLGLSHTAEKKNLIASCFKHNHGL